MNKIKVYINVLLFYLRIRDTLPREIINRILEMENYDPLIDISIDNRFFFADSIKRPVYLRKGVYERLLMAYSLLPSGFFFKIHDAYRTLEEQKRSWDLRFEETKRENKNLSLNEIEKLTRLKVANPYNGYGGHQTGGAIDISFCDEDGNNLKMGTNIPEYNKKTKTKNLYLSSEEKKHRKILKDVLSTSGFKNFPAEWWHFCYGDRMWAAYSRKKSCFYGFVPNSEIKIQKRDIAEGLHNIAEYLGLEPSKTLFIHSTNTNQNDNLVKRIVGHVNLFDHAQVLSYLPRNIKDKTAKALILYVNKDLLNYLNDCGLALKNNYIKIADAPKKFSYPDISVAARIRYLADQGDKKIEILKSKFLVSSFLSADELYLSKKIDVKLIMSPQNQIIFGSKVQMRLNADYGHYRVPLGVEVIHINEIDAKIDKLKKLIKDNNLNVDDVKLWYKLESQSSGAGIMFFKGLTDEIVYKIKCLAMENFSPFVIEIDPTSFNNLRIVANIGVEAVIADNMVTIVGSVLQETSVKNNDKGRYIGSFIKPNSELYELIAEKTSLPAFVNFQRRGYRGFITFDVLVCQNNETGEYFGYNIDPNARFSGGTMLLSLVQYARKMTGKMIYGITRFNSVKYSDNLFDEIKKLISLYLYDGEKTDYQGIIPVIINDLVKTKDNKCNIQTVVLGDNMIKIEKMYNHFKENIKKSMK